MKLLGNRILVKPSQRPDTSIIAIPDSATKIQNEGIVMQLGTGSKLPPELQVGNCILYQRFSGMDTSLDDEGYRILNLEDLIAIIL